MSIVAKINADRQSAMNKVGKVLPSFSQSEIAAINARNRNYGSAGYTPGVTPRASDEIAKKQNTGGTKTKTATSNIGVGEGTAAAQYNLYQQLLNQQKQNAQNAYNSNKNAIQAMYNNSKNSINSTYNSGRGALDASYQAQQEALRRERENANRQAYVNRMNTERDLAQNLSAQGLSGGANESTLAKVYNNYGNSRNAIEEDYTDNITELSGTYNGALADLQSQYNSLMNALEQQTAQYNMQNENQFANLQTDALGDYVNRVYQDNYNSQQMANQMALDKYQTALNSINFKDLSPTNAVEAVNTVQQMFVPEQTNTNASLGEDEETAWNDKVQRVSNAINTIGKNRLTAQDFYSLARNEGMTADEINRFSSMFF